MQQKSFYSAKKHEKSNKAIQQVPSAAFLLNSEHCSSISHPQSSRLVSKGESLGHVQFVNASAIRSDLILSLAVSFLYGALTAVTFPPDCVHSINTIINMIPIVIRNPFGNGFIFPENL
jgi:hypothetical protein